MPMHTPIPLSITRPLDASTCQQEAPMFQHFEQQVRRTPEQLAVLDLTTNVHLSYADLYQQASHLAQRLADSGCGQEEIVGLGLSRGAEAVIAMLAILKQGGAYLPLDPQALPVRSTFLLTQANVRLVLTHTTWRATIARLSSCCLVCVDQLDQDLKEARLPERPDQAAPAPQTNTSALACILPTAGTTGPSKGVCLTHHSLLHQALHQEVVRVLPTDRVAHVSPLTSYPSLWELWATLLTGATLVILPSTLLQTPLALVNALRQHRVSTLYLPTALFHRMARTCPSAFVSLTTLLVGGEAVHSQAVRSILQQHPTLRLVHVYGQAETGGFSLWYEVSPSVQIITAITPTLPLGRPFPSIRAQVLDQKGQPLTSEGPSGELVLSGAPLAQGYLGYPELTHALFDDGFHTGDLVRWTHDERGARLLAFVGRCTLSDGLSLHAFPSTDLEALLCQHPALLEAAFIVSGTPGQPTLTVFLVPTPCAEAWLHTWLPRLQEELAHRLMRYVPSPGFSVRVLLCQGLPLTPTGRIDRARLRAYCWCKPHGEVTHKQDHSDPWRDHHEHQ